VQGDAEHDGLAGSGVVQLNVIFFTLKLSRGPFAGISVQRMEVAVGECHWT